MWSAPRVSPASIIRCTACLSPQSFLPGASEATLNRLTEFVVKKAFLDWEVLASAGRNLRLAVNAPVQGADRSAPSRSSCGTITRGDPNWPGLIIEVTEDEAVQEFDAVSEAAVQLRIYNVTLAIDDFGSGYSSFARLKQLPFSELKLDRSYVKNCATDSDERQHLPEHRRARARDRRDLRRGRYRDRDGPRCADPARLRDRAGLSASGGR